MESTWGLTSGRSGGADKTSHFVVSFPIGTDRDAAARVGRAWAEEMFGTGRFGDRYDYYTAEHRDTEHPHVHVVTYRRGLDHGMWLKVSRRSELNFDTMRQLQVELAAAEGIELEATPRLARGLHERPVPDAKVREEREGRGGPARPPRHTEVTALATAATIVAFSRQIETEGRVLGAAPPQIEALFDQLATSLRDGHQIAARQVHTKSDLEELKAMSEAYAAKRIEITESFERMDHEIAEIDDAGRRAALQRQTAELRREAALLLPDREDLQLYAQRPEAESYQGLRGAGGGPEADGVRAEARARAARIAQEAGLDPDAVEARYGDRAVSEGLRRQWRQIEIAERMQTRAAAGQGVETPDEAARAVDQAHRRIDAAYRDAEERLADMGVSLPDEVRAQADARDRAGRGAAERDGRVEDDLRQLREQRRQAREAKDRGRGRDDDDDGLGL